MPEDDARHWFDPLPKPPLTPLQEFCYRAAMLQHRWAQEQSYRRLRDEPGTEVRFVVDPEYLRVLEMEFVSTIQPNPTHPFQRAPIPTPTTVFGIPIVTDPTVSPNEVRLRVEFFGDR